MKKYLVIAFVIIIVIVLGFIIFFFKGILDDSKNTGSRVLEIKNLYTKLDDNVELYNASRGELSSLFKDIYIDSIDEKYSDIVLLLDKEQDYVKQSKDIVLSLDSYCNDNIYNDSDVSKICKDYLGVYEEMVNVYIEDYHHVNSLVDEYSKKNPGKIDNYESDDYTDYIDYDKDGVYSGKEE